MNGIEDRGYLLKMGLIGWCGMLSHDLALDFVM